MNVHWISPYRTDKNLGKGINDAVKQLNCAPEDWIVHTDQDILFLLPDTKRQIIEILEKTDYDVLGCMTNRLGTADQLAKNMFNVWDIQQHIMTAKTIVDFNYGKVEPVKTPLAGMLLCFRKSVFDRTGGFQEKKLNFDILFCRACNKLGLKLGLMTGVYVFHLYRPLARIPIHSIGHLI